MMKGVAVSESSVTPAPQSKVTVFADASDRLMEGTPPYVVVTSASPHRISLLFPVTVMEVMVAVPFNCSFRPPRTFLNLRFISSVELVTVAIGKVPLPKLPAA